MLRATFLMGSSRLRIARFRQPSRLRATEEGGRRPAQWYDLYPHNTWKRSSSRYARTAKEAIAHQLGQPHVPRQRLAVDAERSGDPPMGPAPIRQHDNRMLQSHSELIRHARPPAQKLNNLPDEPSPPRNGRFSSDNPWPVLSDC